MSTGAQISLITVNQLKTIVIVAPLVRNGARLPMHALMKPGTAVRLDLLIAQLKMELAQLQRIAAQNQTKSGVFT